MSKKINSDQLIRTDNKSSETVVLLGNGAVENGWGPLRNVLDKWIVADKNIPDIVQNLRRRNSEAFHQLSILSYKYKIHRGYHFAQWTRSKNGSKNGMSIADTEKEGLASQIQGFLTLRDAIANEYKKDQAKLALRESKVINSLIGTNARFITTNWDNTLWNSNRFKNVVHLHGRCDFSDSLVFPTELVIEDTAFDLGPFVEDLKGTSEKFQKLVKRTYRYGSMHPLIEAHVKASEWIGSAKRLIVWGYSLGDYDADISALIATYSTRSKELIVINPDPYAFQRTVALTSIVKAFHHNPELKTTTRLI
ncbi:hypothetical protein AZI87_05850 [Bdellovibrio bacteriovorus]|uniref:SIR2-like domain-containing protein n=1 Tax=Bdellovibrio bacteriovorus TaxID=959 RepID=A0A161PEG9_BDEBC|nr:hypothetical protein [Bdellovibrio bacteriovorus]KYG68754.1 hypothetical protein AZI87_05850 [Bdellovibrio bacteriovorus]